MSVLAALLLLHAASDEFPPDWTRWEDGIRPGMETAIVEHGLRISTQQAASDLVRSFPRPVLASEHPLAVFQIFIPPLDEWPTGPNQNGTFNFAGLRLTITRQQNNGLVWPGTFIASGPEGLHFVVRILGDSYGRPIDQAGWWTIGIGLSNDGYLRFYGRQNVVDLTEADCFFTDTPQFNSDGYQTYWPVEVRSFDGWFLQVTEGAWDIGSVRLYAQIIPQLTIEPAGGEAGARPTACRLTVSGGYPQESYQIERSTDLENWLPLNGTVDAISEPRQFYRAK